MLALAERWRDRPLAAYVAAVVASTAALALTFALRGELERVPFVFFYLAVSVAALLGGLGPAILTIVAAILSVDYLIFEPVFSFALTKPGEIKSLLAFGSTAGVISWLASTQRRLWRETMDQADILQEQNVELEIQMEESQSLQEELEQTSEELTALNDELTRNRDFLAQAQGSAQLGSWEWDIKSDRVAWSDQMFRVYGLEPGAMDVGFETFSRMVHPEDRERVTGAIQEALRTKKRFAFDHRVVWPDGTVRWVNSRGRVVTDAAGEPVSMLGSGQDVTDRKNAADAQRLLAEASEALASSLDYRHTLVTVANLAVRDVADWCSVAIGDESGRYENLAVAHRDPERVRFIEEFQKLNPPRFDSPTGVPQVLRTGKPELYAEITPELLEAAAATPEEVRVIRELDMRSAMVVPMIARGRTIGAITFIGAESRRRYSEEDLWFAERLANRAAYAIDNARLFEEARTARAEAEAANAAKAQFLASMSHELRTPLNAIAGYAELMELGVLGPVNHKQSDALSRLQRSRKHLNSLVDQVLSFARIEAGKVEFEIAPVRVNESLVRLAEMIAPQAAGKDLAYDFDGCDPDLAVRADRDRLDQIVLNLIGNAVKYTPSGGSITVFVECDPDTVSIGVRDTGPGIPAEKQQVIFQPFVQLGATNEATSSGVGLGLAISRDLARAMGGDIHVDSVVGKGSTFRLRLPRARNTEAAE
ncbi:MAG TPA: ATP-binding protein [Gemmatimonadaceae bacterium]|nr:ATP-binding protein [Gemmatimonadaceae bacterium]